MCMAKAAAAAGMLDGASARRQLPTSNVSHTAAPPPWCAQLGKEIYGSKQLQEGFRNPALVRFTT